jgi:hypothetical protein
MVWTRILAIQANVEIGGASLLVKALITEDTGNLFHRRRAVSIIPECSVSDV